MSISVSVENNIAIGDPDWTAGQCQYWARQITSHMSALIQSYDHVTFCTCHSINACLGQDVQV